MTHESTQSKLAAITLDNNRVVKKTLTLFAASVMTLAGLAALGIVYLAYPGVPANPS